MDYSELIRAYFERSTALQWYWTVYILVIGGILGFSTFRQRPELVTTLIVTVLFIAFAYKNLGAIEATALERGAIFTVLKDYPASGSKADIKPLRKELEPLLSSLPASANETRFFHVFCDLLTIAAVWGKEWLRRKSADSIVPTTK